MEKELSDHMKRIANNRPKTSDQNGEALIDFLESKLEQILASSNISLKVVFIDLKTGKLHKIAVAVCCSSLKFSLSIF